MEVIGVGIAVIDVIHEVAEYPKDSIVGDSEVQVVCAQLGGKCYWFGVSTDPSIDSDAAFVHSDLETFGVDCSLASIEQGSMPISYIILSRATGSRTIVHSRNLTELSFEAFKKQLTIYRDHSPHNSAKPVLFHFEGRNLNATRQMMLHVRENVPTSSLSVEIEALRNAWESAIKLVALADYTFISKEYLCEKMGFECANDFFDAILANRWSEEFEHSKAFICPWGAEGVYYLEMVEKQVHHLPAPCIDKVIETLGAGDSFVGACLAALSRGNVPLERVLEMACELASAKCSKRGFQLSVEEKQVWQQKLQCDGDCVGANAA